MNYTILAVQVKRLEAGDYEVAVAWQSNLPDCGFAWRVSSDNQDYLPTPADVQRVAGYGNSMLRKHARTYFPFLPKNSVDE